MPPINSVCPTSLLILQYVDLELSVEANNIVAATTTGQPCFIKVTTGIHPVQFSPLQPISLHKFYPLIFLPPPSTHFCALHILDAQDQGSLKLKQVLESIRLKGYTPLALLDASMDPSMTAAAGLACGLPVVSQKLLDTTLSSNQQQKQNPSVAEEIIGDGDVIPPRSVATTTSTMIHYGTVRSGQQIYAEGKSLVVIGTVNSGMPRPLSPPGILVIV